MVYKVHSWLGKIAPTNRGRSLGHINKIRPQIRSSCRPWSDHEPTRLEKADTEHHHQLSPKLDQRSIYKLQGVSYNVNTLCDQGLGKAFITAPAFRQIKSSDNFSIVAE
jgi:hypothetical protein